VTATADHATVELQDPDAREIVEAYRGLPRHGRLLASVPPAKLAETLGACEHAGFVGCQVRTTSLDRPAVELRAYKGKQGPCYDTGLRARYRGAALAALDDDAHFLVGELPVCEKTARIYGLESYRGLVALEGGDADLRARLEDDPASFDCDTYQRDLDLVLERLPDAPGEVERGVALFYPGPFRALVLPDGRLLRRGSTVAVEAGIARELVRRDGCVERDLDPSECPPAPFLPWMVAEEGPACLLGELPIGDGGGGGVTDSRREPDLAALDRTDPELRARLARLIDRDDRHIVLVGSDPDDEFGCCPSVEVGAANRLVRAGVLAAHRKPSPPDACPVTIYACAGELVDGDGDRPDFRPDPAMRARVRERLAAGGGTGGAPAGWRRVAGWALLCFVAVSLVLAAMRFVQRGGGDGAATVPELLGVGDEQGTWLVLFRAERHCPLCDTYAAVGEAIVEEHDDLRFTWLEYDKPGQEHLRGRYSLVAPILFLFEFDGGEVVRAHRLRDQALFEAYERGSPDLERHVAERIAAIRAQWRDQAND